MEKFPSSICWDLAGKRYYMFNSLSKTLASQSMMNFNSRLETSIHKYFLIEIFKEISTL